MERTAQIQIGTTQKVNPDFLSIAKRIENFEQLVNSKNNPMIPDHWYDSYERNWELFAETPHYIDEPVMVEVPIDEARRHWGWTEEEITEAREMEAQALMEYLVHGPGYYSELG